MTQHLGKRAAVAATDDEHIARLPMRKVRRVRQHLVVDEMVALGQHGEAVQGQQAPETLGLVHRNQLVGRALLVQLALQPQRHGEPLRRFTEPVFIKHHGHPRAAENGQGIPHTPRAARGRKAIMENRAPRGNPTRGATSQPAGARFNPNIDDAPSASRNAPRSVPLTSILRRAARAHGVPAHPGKGSRPPAASRAAPGSPRPA